MTDKLEENLRFIYRVIPVQPLQVEPFEDRPWEVRLK